jgi:predicted DNA-binding protein with PD1-like motif
METRPTLEEMPNMWAVSRGRTLMGTLPENRDLIDTVSALCRDHGIGLATFSIHGNVVQATIGVFDPLQQVYVTAVESFCGEIVHCTGWVTGSPAAR